MTTTPKTSHTPLRNIRMEDELWEAAKQKSGGNVSGLVRALLTDYITNERPYVAPRRNVHTHEWEPYSHMTVRSTDEDGEFLRHELFVWGTRRGTYKTDRGLRNAIKRHADETNLATGETGTLGTFEI